MNIFPNRFRQLALTAMLALGVMAVHAEQALYGFTAFPPDETQQAIDDVNSIIASNATVYALHLDQCIPWQEALSDSAYPQWLETDWQNTAATIPAGHKIYVALAPTDTDRRSLAPDCSGQMPAAFVGAQLDHPYVVQAFTNYIRRIVETFSPDFINIGIEIGDLSLRHPDEWPRYEALFIQAYAMIKAQYPTLQIGAEFVLQSLTLPRVAEQVKPLVEASDYIGLSFYPYASDYSVNMGAPPLPSGQDQWLEPLNWVRTYTDKPIAIAETGYLSQPLDMVEFGLHFDGDETTQSNYLMDLVQIANRDNYLFVIWFVPIDYDKLYATLPAGSEWISMWMHTGLYDQDMLAKPAWNEWQKFATTTYDNAVDPTPVVPKDPPPPITPLLSIGFSPDSQIFSCSSGTTTTVADIPAGSPSSSSLQWDYTYNNDWEWCAEEVDTSAALGSSGFALTTKSDRTGAVLLRFDESGGEIYYAFVWVGTDWQQTSLDLNKLSPDPSVPGNGQFDPEQVVSITIADSAAFDGATGNRTLLLTDLMFY